VRRYHNSYQRRPLMLFVALMVVWLFTYDLTVGPLAYAIVGEISSTRLRNKSIALARMSYNVFSVTFGVMTPYMLVRHLHSPLQ